MKEQNPTPKPDLSTGCFYKLIEMARKYPDLFRKGLNVLFKIIDVTSKKK